jgi:hypothetical protein
MGTNMRTDPNHRRRGSVIVLIVGCVLGLTGVAGAAVSLSGSGGDPALRAVAVSRAVDVTVKSRLSVLNRAAATTDTLPAGFRWTLEHSYGFAGPNVAAARRVTASDGRSAYLVPANGGVCAVSTNEALCSPAASLAGADAVDLCSPTLPNGQMEIAWLLPDGAQNVAVRKADGSATAVASGYNFYIARFPTSGSPPATLEWDAGGHRYTVDTGIPRDVQGEKCAHPNDAPPPSALPNIPPGVHSISQLEKLTQGQWKP